VSPAPLVGRLAVVAGASRGIGLAIAEELQGAGAHVVRLARTLQDAEEERRTDIACDVTRAESVAAAVGRVLSARGAPDLLVVAAGGFLLKPLAETTGAEFAEQLTTNLAGPFALLRAFVGPMREKGAGLVITIGSIADHAPLPGNAAYAASKHGLRGLHGVLAAELAGSGVRASLVSPGPVDTDLWDPVDPDARPGFTKRRDMLRARDVAEAVLFLATRPAHVTIPNLFIEPLR
jgi:NAD(P)-dependent dehydrogenase (short-subunit alcohol dehydrogenase family)